MNRRILSWMLALTLAATACGSRLSHQRLLSDSRGGSSSSQDAGVGAGGQGDQSGATADQSGVAGPSGTGTAGGGSISGGTQAGSSGGGSLGATGSSGGGALAGLASSQHCTGTKSTITIGSVGAQSGVVGASVNGTSAIRAWAAAINAHGGLGCHPVKYIVSDDGSDPSRNQAEVQQLIEQDHAIALVYFDSPLDGDASVNYINQHRVPVVGTESAQDWAYSSPMFFPQGDNGATQDQDLFNIVAKQIPNAAVGIFACVEAKACSGAYSSGPSYAQRAGERMAYRAQVSLTQPDFTSECQGAKSAGAQAIMLYVDVNSIDRVLRSCTSINYHPQYAAYSLAAALQTAQDPNANGLLAAFGVLPWVVSSNPGIQAFLQSMAQYAPGTQVGLKESLAYAAAKLFEAAAQHLPDNPTSEDVLNGLWAIKSNTIGGLTNALTFTKDQPPTRLGCTWMLQVKANQWTAANNGQAVCGP